MLRLGIYQHYKGNYYQVVGLARHSETLEELVVYQELYGDYGLWVRPLSLFCEFISYQGKEMLRFTFVKEPFLSAPSFS